MLSLETPARTPSPISTPGGQPLDWATLHRRADASYRAHSDNNEFGLDNKRWNREFRQETLQQKNTRSDEAFLRALRENQEWVDLELLLRVMTEFGARPLLLSMPIHGGWYDQCGVTYTARRRYYRKLRTLGARYHTAVVDFADHDADRSFCFDYKGHLSPSGWVYFSEVLDGFYHGRIRPSPSSPPETSGRAGRAGWTHGALLGEEKIVIYINKSGKSGIYSKNKWPAWPRVRFVALTAYYLAILAGLVALYGKGDFSTPPLIYQNF